MTPPATADKDDRDRLAGMEVRGLRALVGVLGDVLPPSLELVDLDDLHRLWRVADGERSHAPIASAPWATAFPHPRSPSVLTEQGRDFLAWSEQRHRIKLTAVLAGTSVVEQRALAKSFRLLSTAVDADGVAMAMLEARDPTALAGDPLAEAVEASILATRALLGIVLRSVAGALELVTMPQFRILSVLVADGPLLVTGMAERVGAVASVVSNDVDELTAGGWLTQIDKASRREGVAHVTRQGRRLVEDVTVRRRTEVRVALRRLRPNARANLTAALAIFEEVSGATTAADLLVLGLR